MSKQVMELENIANEATAAIEDYLNGYDCFTDVETIILNVLKEAIKQEQPAVHLSDIYDQMYARKEAIKQAGEPVARWNWKQAKLEWLVPYKAEFDMRPMFFSAPSIPAGWQPIETAPKDGTEVLVWFDCASVPVVHIAWYRGEEEWNESGQFCGGLDNLEDCTGWWSYTRTSMAQEKLDGYRTPTHWMPYEAPSE